MIKKDLIKIFIDEIYSKEPMRNYPSNTIFYNHIDEIWSLDLADIVYYKISDNKGFRYMFIIIDNFAKYLWTITLKNRNSKTVTDIFSKILRTPKRSPIKLESDRGLEWYNSIFQNFSKNKNNQRYSRFTDKGPSIAEQVVRTIRNLLKRPVFSAGNADWISELPAMVMKYNNTIHQNIKMTPIQASKK